MSTPPEVVVGNATSHVLMRPLVRGDPEDDWLTTEVEIVIGGFRGNLRADFLAGDFESFRRQLQSLYQTLRGVATFSTIEDQLEMTLTADRQGQVEVTGVARDAVVTGNVLNFRFNIDQTYLPPIIGSLGAVCERFPVVGERRS